MKKPVIFFDWDGTLADSMHLCICGIETAMKKLGLPALPRERIVQCNGPAFDESVHILDIPADKAEAFLRLRRQTEMDVIPTVQRLFPGVRTMLETLLPMADLVVASYGLKDYLHQSAQTLGVDSMFMRIQHAMPGKTKAEMVGILLEELQPTRAVMVGDRLGDLMAGRDNGIPSIAACYGYGNAEEWKHADACAASAEELTNMLTAFCQSGKI